MKRYSQDKIKELARGITDKWLMNHSLKNAKKIAIQIRRNLKIEEEKRKDKK